MSENNRHTVSKINKITYKIIKYGSKYEIRRISKNILNSTYYGSNLLINDLDFFLVERIDNYLVIKVSFNGKEYSKYIFLKNSKFNYLSGGNWYET